MFLRISRRYVRNRVRPIDEWCLRIQIPSSETMNTSVPSPETNSAKVRLRWIPHAAFVLTGVETTLLGPMLPVLSVRWYLNDAGAGRLIAAQFIGSVAGTIASGFLISRRGSQFSMALGLGFMALGLGTLARADWAMGIASIFCYGIGQGVIIPTVNLLVAELNPENRASALSLVNFSWGIGAVACPFLVEALQPANRTSLPLYGMSVMLTVLVVVLVVVLGGGTSASQPAQRSDVPYPQRLDSIPVLMLAATFFFTWALRPRWVDGRQLMPSASSGPRVQPVCSCRPSSGLRCWLDG